MLDVSVARLGCLVGLEAQCELGGLGGATSPLQTIVTTAVLGIAALMYAVWSDAIKTFLKGSLGNLISATGLLLAALVVPSAILVGLAAGVLVLALIFWRAVKGHSLSLSNRVNIPCRSLVFPVSSAVYVVGAIVLVAHRELQPQSLENPTKRIAFFAPSRLINTSPDVVPSDQSRLLSDIDFGPKNLMSGALVDVNIEFQPSFSRDEHMAFRDSFAQKTAARLDYWLSQEKHLKHLSEKVHIALEESAMIQSAGSGAKTIVVRAYLNKRDPQQNRFKRIIYGDSIVAHGTISTLDQVLLVLTVRLAAKLLNELDLPPLDPGVQAAIWRDFSSALRDRIAETLDFRGDGFSATGDLLQAAQDAQEQANSCEDVQCALSIAQVLEDLVGPPDGHGSLLPTASISYDAAFSK